MIRGAALRLGWRVRSGFWCAQWIAAAFALACAQGLSAQTSDQHPKTVSEPATDGSAQASPVAAAEKAPAIDDSVQASPVNESRGHGQALAPHTAIPVRLAAGIDSGKLTNGQNVAATLSTPLKLRTSSFPAGTAVQLSVIATVPAGKLGAAGEFSLQLLRVGKMDVYTETQTFHGQPGHKDLPDSAAQIGTDAGLAAGATLTFHVQPPPVAASGPPKAGVATPGSITARASGDVPPAGASSGGTGVVPVANGQQGQGAVNPVNTTSTPIRGGTVSQPK